MQRSPEDWLGMLARQEKRFDALYRACASAFGLSACAMWVLYFVASSPERLSQQDLHGTMMFPKQTINSAVAKLVQDGLATLEAMPSSRGRKAVALTDAGRELAGKTVLRLHEAECRAVELMGEEKLENFARLYSEFYAFLEDALNCQGLCARG